MHKVKHILLGMAVIAFVALARADDYLLYWQVLDTATVEDVNINDYFSTYAQTHNTFETEDSGSGRIAAARTVFFDAGGNGPSLMYISSYDSDAHIWTVTQDTDTYIRGSDGITVAGTGGGMYSHFTISDPSQLSFAIELGNWENGQWVTLATSGNMSYSDLTVADSDGVHILTMTDNHQLSNFQPWTPQAYSVPEPSSGLLLLVGAGLLALRRRRG